MDIKTHGYTLIEILIVIVIISIISSVAILSLNGHSAAEAKRILNSTKHKIELASQKAMLNNIIIKLNVSSKTITFDYAKPNSILVWHKISEPVFKTILLSRDYKFNLENSLEKSQIIISPSQEITPFKLSIVHKEKKIGTLHENQQGELTLTM